MGFLANRNSKGTTLIPESGGGGLKVISGKAKAANQKAKKDEGTIKKGDTINGIEFALEIADSGNIKGQIFEQGKDGAYGKYIPDPQPITYPLKCTLFVSGNCADAYLALFKNAEVFGLPANIIDGFSADLNIGENKYTIAAANEDFKNADGIKGMLFDNAQAVNCSLEFSSPYTSNGGGKGGQSEAEKLADRLKFAEALMTDSSPEQQAFVKFVAANGGEITLLDFAKLMFG